MEQKLNKQRPGDQGLTDLGDGLRVSKDHVQIAAFGAIDELNCVIGILLTADDLSEATIHLLSRVQQELIQIRNVHGITFTSSAQKGCRFLRCDRRKVRA